MNIFIQQMKNLNRESFLSAAAEKKHSGDNSIDTFVCPVGIYTGGSFLRQQDGISFFL
jgi:hypothetical protein